MARLSFSPEAVTGYEASILSSLSGFVKQLLKHRVDTVEFKLRLDRVKTRHGRQFGGEYSTEGLLEYLNPVTGEVNRSVDLSELVGPRVFEARLSSGSCPAGSGRGRRTGPDE